MWVEDTRIFKSQATEENATSYLFYKLLDNRNILENFLLRVTKDKKIYWDRVFNCGSELIRPDLFHNIALAQHHGIPTRFLDWSSNSYVAAFFAAHQCNNNANEICIWAFNSKYYLNNTSNQSVVFHENLLKQGLEFLHLQRGLFTEMRYHETYFLEQGEWPALDKYCQWFEQKNNPTQAYDTTKYFKKIILPRSQSKSLLSLLNKIDINKGSIMPSYDNITCLLKDNMEIYFKYIQPEGGFRLINKKV